MPVSDLDDPRVWPAAAAGGDVPYADVQRAIDAPTRAEADVFDTRVRRWIAQALADADHATVARASARAPSAAAARHLQRLLADTERSEPESSAALRTTLFAVPVVLVAALDAPATRVTLDGVVADAAALATLLRDARALGGCETFTLSSSLVAADAIDLAALPALLAHGELSRHAEAFGSAVLDLRPAPIAVDGTVERVHLRFIPGAVLTPPHKDPLAESTIGRWGMAFASAIAKALAPRGVSLLALPRPLQRLVPALQAGRAAQREVSAQVFAGNAIRRFRASYGEPTAIVSAHRASDAPGGGELRLSLSSPFAPKAAEGFRCPLYAYESVQDVGAMLDALLRDCQVSDVRFVPGVHPDVDPVTGGPLFFKDHGAAAQAPLH